MSALRMLAVAASVALLAGCAPPVPAHRSTPRADPASYTPGGAPKFGYQMDYSFLVELGYESHDWTDGRGVQYGGLDTWDLRLEWYPDGVQGDEAPYPLQPYLQRSAVLKVGVGLGELELDSQPNSPYDARAFDVGGALFAESGLGVRFDTRYAKAETAVEAALGGEDYTIDTMQAALVWQDENGLSVALGFNKTASHFYEELNVLPSGFQSARRGWGVDVRKVWALDNGGAVDLDVGLEFAKYDMLDVWNIDKDGAVVAGLSLSYYPVKPFGFGVRVERVDLFSDEDIGLFAMHDLDHTAVGGHVTFTLAERVDISATFMAWENDLPNAVLLNERVKENDIVKVSVGVRF